VNAENGQLHGLQNHTKVLENTTIFIERSCRARSGGLLIFNNSHAKPQNLLREKHCMNADARQLNFV